MFLVQTLLTICLVYWVSALIAESVMSSNEERLLPPAIKVGFGFIISTVYFSASWLVMSIQQAWGLGTILLACYIFGRSGFLFKKNLVLIIKNFTNKYSKAFVFFLFGALIFFVPLLISNNYGPFTEGGGDISIYADSAKYLQDKQLTGQGLHSKNISDVMANIKDTFASKSSNEEQKSVDRHLLNPPAAEYAIYRLLTTKHMNSQVYAPYVAYGYLSEGQTNYPVYFGIQAFLYLCILTGTWCFFRQFGLELANAATVLITCSYGVISVFYNMYAMQAYAIAISALILAILPTIRLFSNAGFRTYGAALLILWCSYIHYLSILLPLILGVTFFVGGNRRESNIKYKENFSFLVISAALSFIVLWIFLAWVGSANSLTFAKILLTHSAMKNPDTYFGGSISIFSLHWMSFLFGFLSQQHFMPFVTELPAVRFTIGVGAIFGAIALISGAVVMIKFQNSTQTLGGKKRLYSIIYLLCVAIIIIHAGLAHSFLYTQAKGAQNVLIYLYLVMLLPLAIGISTVREGLKIKKLVRVLTIALVLFVTTLLIPRVVYTAKLAFEHDRSAILESSFFSEAKRILREDSKAFVLFEPRKSADLYTSIQPFFGSRMVPTRHLILDKIPANQLRPYTEADVTILPPDLIEPNDLNHLWTLSSECKEKSSLIKSYNCTWKAERIIDKKNPSILLFGSDYEKNFGNRLLTESSKKMGMFSFLMNGAAMIYLPDGNGVIEAILQPRNKLDYSKMQKEISERLRKGEFSSHVNLTSDGQSIKLTYNFSKNKVASLKLITHFNGEYWLNVRHNHQEIK